MWYRFLITACLAGCLVLPACRTATSPKTAAPAIEMPPPAPPAPESSLESRTTPVTVETLSPGDKVPLTRDGALLTALLHNRSLDVARLGPDIASTYVPEARAQFDPVIGATVSYGRESNPILGSTSTAATSSSGYSGGGTGDLLSLAQGLNQSLYRLGQTVDRLEAMYDRQSDRRMTSGSVTLQQELPTGTLVFLTGTASDTEVEGAARDYRGGWGVGLRQPLLEGAGMRTNLAVLRQAKAQAARGEVLFRAEVLETLRQTELAYWDLVLSTEVRRIREYAVQLADEEFAFTQELLNVGKAIQGDVMAARAERASRQADLSDADAAIRADNVTLIRLLNPNGTSPWDLSFEPADPPEVAQAPVDAETSVQMGLNYRPELEAARLETERAKFAQIQTRNALLPTLDLAGSYGQNSQGATSSGILRHLDDDYFDEYSLGLEFEAPLVNRGEKARHRRAQLVTQQAERTVTDLEQQVSAGVREAVIETERQWQRYQSVGEAVQSRAEQFRVAKGRNAVGKTSILDLHIVERDYIQAQVDEVTARVRYIQALTNLYAAEGTLPARRGITLDKETSTHDQ